MQHTNWFGAHCIGTQPGDCAGKLLERITAKLRASANATAKLTQNAQQSLWKFLHKVGSTCVHAGANRVVAVAVAVRRGRAGGGDWRPVARLNVP